MSEAVGGNGYSGACMLVESFIVWISDFSQGHYLSCPRVWCPEYYGIVARVIPRE